MSYARQKDKSHNPIVEGLEAHGIVVFDCSQVIAGRGLGFDVVCYQEWPGTGSGGMWLPLEIKNPPPPTRAYSSSVRKLKPKGAPKLQPSQMKALARAPIPVVTTLDEALSHFARMWMQPCTVPGCECHNV